MTEPITPVPSLFVHAFGTDYVRVACTEDTLHFDESIKGFVQNFSQLSAQEFETQVEADIAAVSSDSAEPAGLVTGERSWSDPMTGLIFSASVISTANGSAFRRLELVGLDPSTQLDWSSDDTEAQVLRTANGRRWFLWTASSVCRLELIFDGVFGIEVSLSAIGLRVFRVESPELVLPIDDHVFPPMVVSLPSDEFGEDLVTELDNMLSSVSPIERLAAYAMAARLGGDERMTSELHSWWRSLKPEQQSSWLHSTHSLAFAIEDDWDELVDGQSPDPLEGGEDEVEIDPTVVQNVRLAHLAMQRVWLTQLEWLFDDRDLGEVLYRLDETVDVSFYQLPYPVEPQVDSDVLFQSFVLSALSGQSDPWWYLVHAVNASEFDEQGS